MKFYDIFITSLAVILIGGGLLWIAQSIYTDARSRSLIRSGYQNSLPNLGDSIAPHKICMASDKYLGENMLEVVSDHKRYFACSQHCINQLGIDSVRYAIDPVTMQKVDKAMAIASLHPNKTGQIIYLGSADTYRKYVEAIRDATNEK